MRVHAFALPSLEPSKLEFVAIDEIREWVGHETARAEDAAEVLARFAGAAAPGASLRCAPSLAEAGKASGWFPSSKGLESLRRLAAFSLAIDPHCSNRLPLAVLEELVVRATTWQRLDNRRFRTGERVDLAWGLSEGDDDASVDGRGFCTFWGARGGSGANGFHVHYTPDGGEEKTVSMAFRLPEPLDAGSVTCAGLVPFVWSSRNGSAGSPPTMTEVLILTTHLDVLLQGQPEGWGAGSTLGYGDVAVSASTADW